MSTSRKSRAKSYSLHGVNLPLTRDQSEVHGICTTIEKAR